MDSGPGIWLGLALLLTRPTPKLNWRGLDTAVKNRIKATKDYKLWWP